MCGCKKNKNAQARQATRNMAGQVPLNLCTKEQLPLLLKKAYAGDSGPVDVVVLPNASYKPFANALNIPGRNAAVAPQLRDQLVQKWPEKFCIA